MLEKEECLGLSINLWTMKETLEQIDVRLKEKKFTQHSVVNVAKFINMKSDPELKKSVESCDIINIDGQGLVLGARFLGYKVPERVAGIDLFDNLLKLSLENGYPVFLLGATKEIVGKTHDTLNERYPNLIIAGHHHGYFEGDENEVAKIIRNSGARLLFVAITSPKKEILIDRWRSDIGVDFVMGVGGTFDIIAGKTKRAPIWMQDYGLEWFYRVVQEPRRMWKRYFVTNTKFAWYLIHEKVVSFKK